MKYNVIPLRDEIIFPGVIKPLFIGRPASIKAINAAIEDNMQVILVSQKAAETDSPTAEDVYRTGTLANIIQVLKLPDGTLKLSVEGKQRVEIKDFLEEDLSVCEADLLTFDEDYTEAETQSVRKMLLAAFERYLKLVQKSPKELLAQVKDLTDLSLMSDIIASHTYIKLDKKVDLLLENDVKERVAKLLVLLESEVELIDLEKTIRNRVKVQMDKNQREYYLNEQAKAIQKELEEIDETKSDFGQLESSIKACKMPELVEEKCLSELEKLKKMPPLSSEATVLRNYIENMIDYPWSKADKTNCDIKVAKDVLAASHYGLEEVKKRIVEYLAVQERTKKPSGSILCLVGPPGVGKTSIGKSIAKAVNRKYVRMALGGVRDEAEIRGHRRTYIGALPGKIVQNITKAKVNNPLFLLDEIDKMGMDHRGDPASAMLEVLDPEQNHTFNDHYMEVDIDLSQVMFIATANSLDIPGPLLDRMEIIRIPGYTESEKLAIAKKYLLPRNIQRNGLKNSEINITDKALKLVVENYTREAGVRRLDRELDKVCRKVVAEIMLSDVKKISISKNNLSNYLGAPKYLRDEVKNGSSIGKINGLAWTSVGGELLNIEVAILPGKGKVALTGKLGEVMQESVQAAMTVVKSYTQKLGISHKFFQEHDFHIHLPEAATPKDGPSAGTAMTTAILSAIIQSPISHQIAMTGEITLQGNVLAIGGLKEKLFAAAREGIEQVFIPQSNEKDLEEISEEIKSVMTITPVSHVNRILTSIFPELTDDIDNLNNNNVLIENYRLTGTQQVQKH